MTTGEVANCLIEPCRQRQIEPALTDLYGADCICQEPECAAVKN